MGVLQEEQEAAVERLLELCREGKDDWAIAMIQSGLVGVDAHDDDDVTPVQAASAAGNLELVKRLIKMGADINLCNQYGWTPIIHAAYNGHVDLLQFLVQSGANLMHKTYMGISALTLAAGRGNLKVVHALIELGLDESYSIDEEADIDLTPVMAAAVTSQDSAAKFLLSRGANVNAAMQDTGLTALMLAAMFGHVTSVQLLLDSAADPNAETLLHHTALSLATAKDCRETRDLLQSRTFQKLDPDKAKGNIMEAIEAAQFARAKQILREDASAANFVDPETGKTPLMAAATLGKMDLVEILVARGAALNHQSRKNGLTALMLAIAHEKPGIAKFLIAAGANIDVRDHEGRSAFDVASQVNAGQDLLSVLGQKTGITSLKPELHNNRTPEQPGIGLWRKFPKLLAGKLKKRQVRKRDEARRNSSLEETRLSTTHRQSRGLPDLTWEKQLFADPVANLGDCFKTLDSILMESCGEKSTPNRDPRQSNRTGSTFSNSIIPALSFSLHEASEEPPRSLAAANALKLGPGQPIRSKRFHHGFKSTSKLNLKGSDLFLHQQQEVGFLAQKYPRATLPRPHSYHDPPGVDGSKRFLAPVPMLRLTRSNNRPHSYHDHHPEPLIDLHNSTSGLPVTPTRKSFGFFSGLAPTDDPQFSSAPFLNASSPNSSYSGDSLKRRTHRTPKRTPMSISGGGGAQCSNEIGAFLKSLSLEQYVSVFEEQEIDLDTFFTLTDADLLELGIEEEDSRAAILSTLEDFAATPRARANNKRFPKSPDVVDFPL